MSRGHASTNQTFFAGESYFLHRGKMSTHALQKMTRDWFRVMSLAPRRKFPRNVVQMKGAMAALFGSDTVAISFHCKRSKIILVKVLTEVCSLENIASWDWRYWRWDRWFACGRHSEKVGIFDFFCLLHVPCNSVQKEIRKKWEKNY